MKTVKEIRAELTKMSDAQLIEHGKTLRQFCRPTPGRGIDRDWLMQLKRSSRRVEAQVSTEEAARRDLTRI
jgi:hypothetical protein